MGDDEKFWDAVADDLKQRDRKRNTAAMLPPVLPDVRMPAASAAVPSDLVGSHARPSADYSAMPRSRTPWLVIALAVVVVGGIAAAAGFSYLHKSIVTKSQFDQISIGMSLAQCREIIGSDGTTFIEAAGLPAKYRKGQEGIPFIDSTVMVEWHNPDGSSAVVCVVGEKVTTKTQLGL